MNNRILRALWFACAVTGCASEASVLDETAVTSAVVAPAPLNAKPAYGDFDGDGCMDIGLKSGDGNWYIDECKNGFGGPWDHVFFNYGDATVTPCPADYDGDLKTDLAVKTTAGVWSIDYAYNGFGTFDAHHFGYGYSDAVPVPADYDGDGKADLSVKDGSGVWAIDYAANEFVGWNDVRSGYGGADWIAVPANYDGDVGPGGKPRADRAVKTNAGEWKIDYSYNGYGITTCYFFGCVTRQWDIQLTGYGGANAVPVPADYDRDGYADLAIKDDAYWRIDRRANGYAYWDNQYPFSGGWQMVAIPGDFNPIPPGGFIPWLDMAVHSFGYGYSLIDLQDNGIALPWDHQIDNPNRPAFSHPSAPKIAQTRIRGPLGIVLPVNAHYALRIGQKYTIEVVLQAGSNSADKPGVVFNPELLWPMDGRSSLDPVSLKINDRLITTPWVVAGHEIRRSSIVCSEAGTFPVGFVLTVGGTLVNADHGIRVRCSGEGGGLIKGRVTERICLPRQSIGGSGSSGCGSPGNPNAHYSVGPEPVGTGVNQVTAIGGATVVIEYPGHSIQRMTDANGDWGASVPANVPVKVTISKPGFATTIAVSVRVPGGGTGGLDLFTPLEDDFDALLAKGMHYTTYVDYSRGRTLIHVVDMSSSMAMLKNIKSAPISNPTAFKALVYTAQDHGIHWPVVMNGGLFQDTPLTGTPVGYFYSADNGGYVSSIVPKLCLPKRPGCAPRTKYPC